MLLIPLQGKVYTFAPYWTGSCRPVGVPNLQFCYFLEAVHPVRCDRKGASDNGMLPLPHAYCKVPGPSTSTGVSGWPCEKAPVICKLDNACKPPPVTSSKKLTHGFLVYSLVFHIILLWQLAPNTDPKKAWEDLTLRRKKGGGWQNSKPSQKEDDRGGKKGSDNNM